MSSKVMLSAVGGLLMVCCLSQITLSQPALSQDAKTQPAKKQEPAKVPAKVADKPQPSADLDLLHATAEQYEKAFNAGNAKELAALFSEKAEVVDENGDVLQGRADIEARYVELF